MDQTEVKVKVAFRIATRNPSSGVLQTSTTCGVTWLTRKMAKFEKTDAYMCSGTAQKRLLASTLH